MLLIPKVSILSEQTCYFHNKINFNIPIYLISTSLIPAETADMHTDIENEDFRP